MFLIKGCVSVTDSGSGVQGNLPVVSDSVSAGFTACNNHTWKYGSQAWPQLTFVQRFLCT